MIHEGVRKLKLDKYSNILIAGRARALEALAPWLEDPHSPHEAVIEVVLDLEEMRQALHKTFEAQLLKDKGILFLLYPKKGNKQYASHIHRDSIFEALSIDEAGYFENTTLKFNSMTAFDDVFTALGIKNEPTKAKLRNQPSQSVEDYKDKVEDLKVLLDKDSAARYMALTPGYQVGWARHIFSTNKEDTRLKRLEEMKTILAEGYKSIDLWRKAKK